MGQHGQQENEKWQHMSHMFHLGLLAVPLRRFRAAKDQNTSFAWLDTLQMRDISFRIFHSAISQPTLTITLRSIGWNRSWCPFGFPKFSKAF